MRGVASMIAPISRTPISKAILVIASVTILYKTLLLSLYPESANDTIPTFVLSSKRENVQLQRLILQLSTLVPTTTYIFPEVDCDNLTEQEKALMEKTLIPNKLTSPQINCFLTNILLWQYIQQNNIPLAIILKEKSQRYYSIHEILHIISREKELDVVYLGNYTDSSEKKVKVVGNSLQKATNVKWTDEYIISYRAAFHLTDYLLSNKSSLPLDSLMPGLCNATGINIMSLSPRVV